MATKSHKKKKKKNIRAKDGKKNKPANRSNVKQVIFTIVFGLIYLIASALFSLAVWYKNTFDISFSDLLFTMLSPLGGTGESTLAQIFSACLPPTIAFVY